jgi:hypothetical protein
VPNLPVSAQGIQVTPTGFGAELLVNRGAKLNIFDAISCRDLSTATALLSANKALALATNRVGAPVLASALITGDDAVLKLLLDRGATPTCRIPPSDQTPLHLAAMQNRAGAAEMLIRRAAKVDATDLSGLTPLHWAAIRGSGEAAAVLLKHKADPNARSPRLNGGFADEVRGPGIIHLAGNTPLHLAALCAQTNLIAVLLKAGASVNATNGSGNTPLDLVGEPRWLSQVLRLERIPTEVPQPLSYLSGARGIPPAVERQNQQAAATLLENAGAKRSSPRLLRATPGFHYRATDPG